MDHFTATNLVLLSALLGIALGTAGLVFGKAVAKTFPKADTGRPSIADWLPAICALLGVVFGVWIGWLVLEAKESNLEFSIEPLPAILFGILILLVATILALVAAASLTNSLNKDQAFGLPRGSVRGLLAFVVLGLFAGVVFFMVTSVAGIKSGEITGLTHDQYLELSRDEAIVAIPTAKGGETYDVTIYRKANDVLAENLGTIIGGLITLVSGLSGFYFGNRSATPVKPDKEDTRGTDPDGRNGSSKMSDTFTLRGTAPLRLRVRKQGLLRLALPSLTVSEDVLEGGKVVFRRDGDNMLSLNSEATETEWFDVETPIEKLDNGFCSIVGDIYNDPQVPQNCTVWLDLRQGSAVLQSFKVFGPADIAAGSKDTFAKNVMLALQEV